MEVNFTFKTASQWTDRVNFDGFSADSENIIDRTPENLKKI